MAKTTKSTNSQASSYEIFITALSVLSVVNMFLFFFAADENVQTVLSIINILLSVIFLADFCISYANATSKKHYFFNEFGWADLLGSVPIPQLKFLRVFRIWRAVRLLRKMGLKKVISELIESRAQSALLVVFFLIILLLEFGSMAMVWIERSSPDANILSGSDAIWWVYVTITTVGYGDRFPVTNGGRIIGMLVMMAGVGLFGILTGYLANMFLTPSDTKPKEEKPAQPDKALLELNKLMLQQQKVLTQLSKQMNAVEKKIK